MIRLTQVPLSNTHTHTLAMAREGWMDRRTLKRDKGDRLDLQQQLQAEIAAKTRIQEELTQITSQYTNMER